MRSEEELMLERCREIFNRFDRNKDGGITELELGALLRSMGIKPDSSQIESLFNRADRDNNGVIDFAEFMQLVSSNSAQEQQKQGIDEDGAQQEELEQAYNDEELVKLFRAFDKDGNGFITAAELAHSMAKMGRRLSMRELRDMMAEADADGDGLISFDEFVTALSGQVR